MNKLASTLVLLGATATVAAEPIEYTFVLENVEQGYFEYPDSTGPGGGPIELIEVPIGSPLYPETVSVSGSFTYNPDTQGIVFGNTIEGEPSNGSVAYPLGAIDAVVLNIGGHQFVTGGRVGAFSDETTGTPQPDGPMPSDALIFLSFISTNLATPITYDGRAFDRLRSSFFFVEGETTGFNFFPDAVLGEPFTEGPSPVALPATLPPNGAEVRRVSITLSENNITLPRRQYTISGDLVLTPAPPEPEPGPRDYVFEIEVAEQRITEDGVDLPLINPLIDKTTEISGGFTYDPTPFPSTSNIFFCDDQTTCMAGGTPTGELAGLSVSMLGQTWAGKTNNVINVLDENNANQILNPSTYPTSDLTSGPQDLVGINTLPFGLPASNIEFEFDGISYQLLAVYLAMWEGDTGSDFFPADPLNAGLPLELPPEGAEFLYAALSFRSTEEISPGVNRFYLIRGPMTLRDAPIDVAIDVDPFSTDNKVLPDSDETIAVSIASSSTVNGEAVDFDTSKIDPESLKFGRGHAPNVSFPLPFDFTGDNNTDLAVAFETQASGILCNDTEVTLSGETYSGQSFEGTDTIDATECDDSCHP